MSIHIHTRKCVVVVSESGGREGVEKGLFFFEWNVMAHDERENATVLGAFIHA